MAELNISGLEGEALLEALQQYATNEGASDLHATPEREGVRMEMRLHGQLRPLVTLTKEQFEQVLRHIKFLAKLKLNVTDLPQDGQYTFEAVSRAEGLEQRRRVNVRVASLPSRFGETITLRMLDPLHGIVALQSLGFEMTMEQQLADLVKLPHGLILVTGPTGSGKTTTLYALLNTLVGTAKNIITLEDPVEYELKGIVQSEIDVDNGFTFASGLRSVLRHDPNVILVGEIRDKETAETAIDAALTGHLVLATLHTNSATEAVTRLLSMGVSPATFAPALRAILAQRLVRTIKPELQKTQVDALNPETYGGRQVLAELLTVSPAMRELIEKNASIGEIETQAAKDGYVPMKNTGAALVKQGITTPEEIARVTA